MNITEKLQAIQSELKAPKGQFNDFGKYKYRSCEDILEAAKPLLAKYKCAMFISDELLHTGERYYIKATVTLHHAEEAVLGGGNVETTAYAREEETKKGMDGSQITGTASSYARKYALNGLFLIDDTKDADTDEHRKQTEKPTAKDFTDIPDERVDALLDKADQTKDLPVTPEQLKMLYAVLECKVDGATAKIAKTYEVADLADLTRAEWADAMQRVGKVPNKVKTKDLGL